MKELITLNDLNCIKRYMFRSNDKASKNAEVNEKSFVVEYTILKLIFINMLSYIYKNGMTSEFCCSKDCADMIMSMLLKKGYKGDIDIMSSKIVNLLKRDIQQSEMYDKKTFYKTFKISLSNNKELLLKVDKFEKSSENNIYRITNYCNSLSSTIKNTELTATLLSYFYDIHVSSFSTKSLTKSDELFLGLGDRSHEAYILEEPFREDLEWLNMKNEKLYHFYSSKFNDRLILKHQDLIENIKFFDEKLDNLPVYMNKISECKNCKYNRYCLRK